VVEKLYRAKWTRLDGLGGLVLTPTRELAVQIFEELKKARRYNDDNEIQRLSYA
jgi:ATP-dependent RNA helicase DDX10/DBP4